ncbi:MAG TPA: PAS domain-containing sensor histidine kinase [Deltaproteobacteria bacterium]|nr:PAS domain-containing sensor histidine kinase [Deltaproteobacteria bacterium]
MVEDRIIDRETFGYLKEHAPVLFFVLSEEGRIVDANAYACSLTGRSLVGENLRNIIVDFSGRFDLKAVMGEPSLEPLIHIGTASGLPQSFYFTFKPVSDHILALGRLDAEEIEKTRKEVSALNQELNNLMRELHKKNAQLKRLDEEKNQFLGMAAHDLRKPIGLIITYSEFLMEEAADLLDGEQKGFLNTINSSCTFMKRLVDDFLDVSAIEAGRFDLELQLVNITTILEESLKLNHLQAIKKGIVLQVQAGECTQRMAMDASKIEQAITNLVSNAIEHTQPGTKVNIALACDQQSMTFSVRDRGPGIPPEEMKKLFKPFEKTSAKKTGGEKSTGLGMLITRKIIEAHGGEIWVDSTLGSGTTVYFRLPRKGWEQ